MSFLLGHLNYIVVVALMMLGLFVVFSSGNLIKRMVGLALFQTSTGLFYISVGKVAGGTAPIVPDPAAKGALAAQLDPTWVTQHGVDGVIYSNPLPQALILTAIVVGVATLAVGLSIAVRLREAYGTLEADDIAARDRDAPPREPLSGAAP